MTTDEAIATVALLKDTKQDSTMKEAAVILMNEVMALRNKLKTKEAERQWLKAELRRCAKEDGRE